MAGREFCAFLIEEQEGKAVASRRKLTTEALPDGDVLVRVAFSSLNYKDALAVTGRGKVVRRYPMIPGVDLAGTVEESTVPDFKAGDQVVVTGWGLGERHWGGYAQFARVKADWLLPLPEGMSLKHAMSFGTAGLTAMLSVMALEEHGLPFDEKRPVVVTGAGGGLGSMGVAILSRKGYCVAASTGRPPLHEYLRQLGASQLLDRQELASDSGKPLESERWGGAIDTVGGKTLAGLLRGMAYGTSVAACGLAGGAEFSTTVFPFILRGVNLLGIESVMCPQRRRAAAWNELKQIPSSLVEMMTTVVPLSEILPWCDRILAGQVRGRVVVDVWA
jgi:putative quinone oxidoreductase, YhdH/YhfP family